MLKFIESFWIGGGRYYHEKKFTIPVKAMLASELLLSQSYHL